MLDWHSSGSDKHAWIRQKKADQRKLKMLFRVNFTIGLLTNAEKRKGSLIGLRGARGDMAVSSSQPNFSASSV